MAFRITGLPAEPFQEFFGLSDAELHARGARRMRAEAGGPAMPCRVSLRDAAPGEAAILLNYAHQTAPGSPYRSAGPIFVREGVAATAGVVDVVPEQQRTRLLSVRAYDTAGMIVDAEVVEGTALEPLIARFFAQDAVAYLHAHNARRGCYACRIDRA